MERGAEERRGEDSENGKGTCTHWCTAVTVSSIEAVHGLKAVGRGRGVKVGRAIGSEKGHVPAVRPHRRKSLRYSNRCTSVLGILGQVQASRRGGQWWRRQSQRCTGRGRLEQQDSLPRPRPRKIGTARHRAGEGSNHGGTSSDGDSGAGAATRSIGSRALPL